MKKLIAEGYCGEQHTIDELNECRHCRKYRETWNAAIEAAANHAIEYINYPDEIIEQIRSLKK